LEGDGREAGLLLVAEDDRLTGATSLVRTATENLRHLWSFRVAGCAARTCATMLPPEGSDA